jgi:hypothetical protein
LGSPFEVREELYDIKGKYMDAVFVQHEVDVKGSSGRNITEWEYVFMEGVQVCEQNTKRSNHVSSYGQLEAEDEDDDASMDFQL